MKGSFEDGFKTNSVNICGIAEMLKTKAKSFISRINQTMLFLFLEHSMR